MALTNIFYYIPDDKESQEELNVFKIQKGINEVRLADIKHYFPVPGDYHFRFQFKHQG